MGAFFLLRKHNGTKVASLATQLHATLTRQGFSNPLQLDTPDYFLALYPKQQGHTPQYVELGDGKFCACTGTLLYKTHVGPEALRHLHADFNPNDPPLADLYGCFCVILRKWGQTYLFLDRLGTYKVYHSRDAKVWSTSFLTATAVLSQTHVAPQEVYEYVFEGATYGNQTIFKEVVLADCDTLYQLGIAITHLPRRDILPRQIEQRSMDEHVERSLSNLRAYYRVIAQCFGDRVDTALSGGYDSRLTLALLWEQGSRPKVHVYGRLADVDVRIAQHISLTEGFALAHVDKSRLPPLAPDQFAATVEENFYAFDGYPPDGIFHDSNDLAARRMRCQHGELMLNGGGGEIFRNFFYLPDRPLSVRQLLWSFYSRFDPRLCSTQFSESDFHARLGAKILQVLGTDCPTLTRTEIELVYPLFRCRYWMGRNNALNNRLGHALTPFIDFAIVKDALTIPTHYKNTGQLEARLITAINPRLAAYPSAYGHHFAADPSRFRRLKETLNCLRPPALRRYTYRLKNRWSRGTLPSYLCDNYRDAALPAGFPYLRRFFRMDGIHDPAQFNRICTLEYLFQRFQPQYSA